MKCKSIKHYITEQISVYKKAAIISLDRGDITAVNSFSTVINELELINMFIDTLESENKEISKNE